MGAGSRLGRRQNRAVAHDLGHGRGRRRCVSGGPAPLPATGRRAADGGRVVRGRRPQPSGRGPAAVEDTAPRYGRRHRDNLVLAHLCRFGFRVRLPPG